MTSFPVRQIESEPNNSRHTAEERRGRRRFIQQKEVQKEKKAQRKETKYTKLNN
jgi:hypothetical protein